MGVRAATENRLERERVSLKDVALAAGCATIPPLFGICCWMTFGFFPDSSEWALSAARFTEASSASQVVGLLAWAAVGALRPGSFGRCVRVACLVLLGGGLALLRILVAAGIQTRAASCGGLVGLGMASLMVAWELVVSRWPGGNSGRVVLAGMAASPIFCPVLVGLPSRFVADVATFVLAPASLVLLFVLGREIREGGASCPEGAIGAEGSLSARLRRGVEPYRPLAPRLFASATCAFVLVSITVVADTVSLGQATPAIDKVLLANGALLLSSVVLLAVFGGGREFSLLKLYFAFAPVLVVLLFFVPFSGGWYGRVLMFVGLAVFFSVQTGLMLLCAEWSRSYGLSAGVLYGVVAGVAYFSRYACEKALAVVHDSGISWESQALAVVAFSIYLFSVAGYAALRVKNAGLPRRAFAFGRQDGLSSDSARFLLFCKRMGLSRRESDVAELLCSGLDVPEIAETLVLSKNTIRSHVKSIYKKCSVHGKDELVDLAHSFDSPR